MKESTVYYRAAGRSLEAINLFLNRRDDAIAKAKEFARRFGGELVVNGGISGAQSFPGLIFDGNAPIGWREITRPISGGGRLKFWIPITRTKSGKSINKEMEQLRIREMGSDVGGNHFTGSSIFSPGFEPDGTGGFIIMLHEQCTPPADGIPMKRSEYWAHKEAMESEKSIVAGGVK